MLIALDDRFSVARVLPLLHYAGCRVTVVGDPRTAVCASRFVDDVIPCCSEPSAAGKLIRRVLRGCGENLPWVIFADEAALEAGLLCRGEDWFGKVFPVDPLKSAEMIIRKAAFMEAAEIAGVPVPKMRVCRTVADAAKAGSELKFPVFAKRDLDCAGAGVVRVDDKFEVVPVYRKLCNTGPVVIQEMVRGAAGKTNMLCHRGRLMCHTSAYTVRTWLGEFGPGCVREYFCDERLENIARQIGSLTGFHGLCGFDWIQDEKTGKFIVIEFNGRISATYHHGKYVGVDYGRAIADFVRGRATAQRPRMRGGGRPTVYMFPQDVRRCIETRDFIGLVKWCCGAITTDIPWDDANLILFFVRDLIRGAGKRIARWLFQPTPAGRARPRIAPRIPDLVG